MSLRIYNHAWFLAALCCFALPRYADGKQNAILCQTGNTVEMSMKTNKSSYVVGEPIVVSLTLTNAGSQPVTYRWFRLPQSLNFQIHSADGQRVLMRPSYPEGTVTIGTTSLAPRESLTTDIDVVIGDIIEASEEFPRTDAVSYNNVTEISRYRLVPGRYTISAVQGYLLAGQASFLDEPERRAATASVTIEVRAPTATEKAALQLWMQPRLSPSTFTSQPLFRPDYQEIRQGGLRQAPIFCVLARSTLKRLTLLTPCITWDVSLK